MPRPRCLCDDQTPSSHVVPRCRLEQPQLCPAACRYEQRLLVQRSTLRPSKRRKHRFVPRPRPVRSGGDVVDDRSKGFVSYLDPPRISTSGVQAPVFRGSCQMFVGYLKLGPCLQAPPLTRHQLQERSRSISGCHSRCVRHESSRIYTFCRCTL